MRRFCVATCVFLLHFYGIPSATFLCVEIECTVYGNLRIIEI